MKSDHATVLRIRAAMTMRGIATNGQLATMAGLDQDHLRKLISDGRVFPISDNLDRIAKALVVPVAWLMAVDEAKAKKEGPPWAATLPSPRTKKLRDPTPEPIAHNLSIWENALERAWRDYLDLQRSPRDTVFRAVIGMPTVDGKPWPLYHRTITLTSVARVASAFSWAQQHALATAFDVSGTPDYEQLMSWVAEREADLKKTGHRHCKSAHESVCPWPLVPTGTCFATLTKRLTAALDDLQSDAQPDDESAAAKASKDRPDADDLRAALRRVFSEQFPDDPLVDLYEAVRQYRAFAKANALGVDEQAARWPFKNLEVHELWDQLITAHGGRLITHGELASWYEAVDLPVSTLSEHIVAYESQGWVRRVTLQGSVWVLVYHLSERPKRPTKAANPTTRRK